MELRSFDPAKGQAFQGDVSIIPMPDGIALDTTNEIKPVKGRLVLQEGEVTGHHHAIHVRQRNFKPDAPIGDPVLHVRDTKLRRAFTAAKVKLDDLSDAIERTPTARMYRDPAAVQAMLTTPVKSPAGTNVPVLTRADLAIGCLVVEGDGMPVKHEEHAPITIPPGRYVIGGQVESAGAEERKVLD